MSLSRGVGLLALVACTLLLFTVVPSVTVNAATENAVEWNQHVTFVDSLEDELNQPTALIESDADVDSEVELDDSVETELDTDLADQFSDELDQELDQEADQDSDAEDDATTTSHGFMELSQGPKPQSKFAAAVSKVKNVLKGLNPFAAKLPPQSPAQVLSPQENQAKWAAFKAANPKKKYKTSADEQKAFNAFQANRAKILEQNNAAATKLNPKPFASKGPLADIPAAQFRATHLKAKRSKVSRPSVLTKKGAAVTTAATAAKKHRFAEKPGAGGKVSASGTSASASGTSASASGTSASASGTSASSSGGKGSASGTSASSAGKIGSASGTSASASGTSASSSGKIGSASGTSASASGTSASQQVVAPTAAELAAAEKFKPYTGSAFNNPADDNVDKRVCRVVSTIWFARYASTAWDRFIQFGVKSILGISTNGGGFERFQKDPMLLCSASGWDAAWDKLHPKQQLIRSAFKELMSHPSGTPFMNAVVATSDQVLDQAQCGSCWAQAAVGSLEVALKKANRLGATERLSVQQVIDCVHTADSNGCGGGTPMDVINYFKTTAPSLEVDYPYTGVQGQCNIKKADPNHRSAGWEFVTPPPQGINVLGYDPCTGGPCTEQIKFEIDLLFGVKTAGPYIVYVDADQWQHYAGGIYPPDKCSPANEAGNHVVQLLGYGQENGIPYWIIKNSWGTEWGEKGHIRLPMGVNACGVANYVLKAKA